MIVKEYKSYLILLDRNDLKIEFDNFIEDEQEFELNKFELYNKMGFPFCYIIEENFKMNDDDKLTAILEIVILRPSSINE